MKHTTLYASSLLALSFVIKVHEKINKIKINKHKIFDDI